MIITYHLQIFRPNPRRVTRLKFKVITFCWFIHNCHLEARVPPYSLWLRCLSPQSQEFSTATVHFVYRSPALELLQLNQIWSERELKILRNSPLISESSYANGPTTLLYRVISETTFWKPRFIWQCIMH